MYLGLTVFQSIEKKPKQFFQLFHKWSDWAHKKTACVQNCVRIVKETQESLLFQRWTIPRKHFSWSQ